MKISDENHPHHGLYRRARWAMDDGQLAEAAELFRKCLEHDFHAKTVGLLGECLLPTDPVAGRIHLFAAVAMIDDLHALRVLAEWSLANESGFDLLETHVRMIGSRADRPAALRECLERAGSPTGEAD